MLRDNTLKTIQSAIARGEPVSQTPDAVHAIERAARQMRAQTVRDAFRNGFTWLFRSRDVDLPAGKIDAVRGH